MCGIFCLITTKSVDEVCLKNVFNLFEYNVKRRGPDCVRIRLHHSLLFGGSVLWLQGNEITPQPLEEGSHVLLFNGDIYDGCLDTATVRKKKTVGDTRVLFDILSGASDSKDASKIEVGRAIVHDMSTVRGPYAFIFYDKVTERVYFARDRYGRKSLLLGTKAGDGDGLVICSVASKVPGYKFAEVPAIGVFCIDLRSKSFHLYPWWSRFRNFDAKVEEFGAFLETHLVADRHEKLLSVDQPERIFLPKQFAEPEDSDLKVLRSIEGLEATAAFKILLDDDQWSDNLMMVRSRLLASVKERVANQPRFCRDCVKTKTTCKHAITGVLFSGGIDCAILALLASRYTEEDRPIDLFNVAFDRGGKGYDTPDRVTGRQTLEELRALHPYRQWNFVEIDVSEAELNAERTRRIADLIYPLNTVLDDSLGCALWFAARGRSQDYVSPCRVILAGMGADELFGGYSRHRAALAKEGFEGLHKMLEEDWQNIAYRNLGRDDRVICDHGRQLRTPYLEELVVSCVRNLACWHKTYPASGMEQGVGEKILLRCLGFQLGLVKASCLKKRALQFGTRIADPKENAHDVSHRL